MARRGWPLLNCSLFSNNIDKWIFCIFFPLSICLSSSHIRLVFIYLYAIRINTHTHTHTPPHPQLPTVHHAVATATAAGDLLLLLLLTVEDEVDGFSYLRAIEEMWRSTCHFPHRTLYTTRLYQQTSCVVIYLRVCVRFV